MASNKTEYRPSNRGEAYVNLNMCLTHEPTFHAFGERGVVNIQGAVNFTEKVKDQKEPVQRTTYYSGELYCNIGEDGQPMGSAGILLRNYGPGKWVKVRGPLKPRVYPKNDGTEGLDLRVQIDAVSFDNLSPSANEGEEEQVTSRRPASAARQSAPAGRASGGSGRRQAAPANSDDEFEWSQG